MCGLRPGSAVTNDHNVDEGSESAFSVAHRNCCSKRRMSDSASTATTSGPASSSRTQSMTPRAGRRTGTSSVALHLGWRIRSNASSIRVWLRSRSGGPVLGKSLMLRSAPSAIAIRLRTSLDGRASPVSISQRWAALTSDARARRRSPIPASSRCRRMSDPIARNWARVTAAARRWISERPTQLRVPVSASLALIGPVETTVRCGRTRLGTKDNPPPRQGASRARPFGNSKQVGRQRGATAPSYAISFSRGEHASANTWRTRAANTHAANAHAANARAAAARRMFTIAGGSGAGSAIAASFVAGSLARAQEPRPPRVGRAGR